MLYQICVIRDSAADVFGQPIFVPAIGIAVRSFGDECKRKDANNQMNKHPEDFEMFKVGTYDDNTCEFVCQKPVSIARGADYKE